MQNLINIKISLFLTLCFIFIFQIETYAFSFRNYKSEDGLSNNTVSGILQDCDGFIWISTENGLNKFEGDKFRTYYLSHNEEFESYNSFFNCILEVDEKQIWIGTDNGIFILDKLTEKIERFVSQVNGVAIASNINNMVFDNQNNIWISTYGQGIFKYETQNKRLFQYRIVYGAESTKVFDYINHIYADSKNNVWAAPKSPDTPLILYSETENCFNTYDIEEQNQISVYKILEDSKGVLWLGTWDKGICRLNKNERNVTSYISPENNGGILHVHDICEYDNDVLLIGSDDGLSLFNTLTGTHQLYISSELDIHSLSDKFIYPIIKDREGGIWIGTYFGGLNYISPASSFFERYTHSKFANSVGGNVIAGFSEDKNGNIWIASDDGGLNMFDVKTGEFKTFLPEKNKNSISYHNVHALCWDDDDLWIGTYSGGLNVLNSKTNKFKYYGYSVTDTTTLDGGSIYSIFKDKDNQMWVATMSGINLYDREADNFIRVKETLTTTIAIEQDDNGWLWFVTIGRGVFRFIPEENLWSHFYFDSGVSGSLPANIVNSIKYDSKKRLWFGTTAGLCKYNYEKDIFEIEDINMPGKIIYSIIEDNDGYLWLTTNRGLIRYCVADKKTLVYSKNDGLVSEQFIMNSGFMSSSGKIYVGTANGFNAFNPKNIYEDTSKVTVAITDVEIFNKPIEITNEGILTKAPPFIEKLELNYKQNAFTISFLALNYASPEKISYSYKLEGFDKEWNYVGVSKSATYTNLPYGKYLFKVRAFKSNINNEEIKTISVIINPPFWLTLPFKILYFIIFIVLIMMFLHQYQLKHKVKIKILEQEKEKEIYNAKNSFFTTIAHEIRTPVSLIIGPLEKILDSEYQFPEVIKKDIDTINRNGQRLLELVNQLLDYRKAEQKTMKLNFEKTNIFNLLCSITDRFKPAMEKRTLKYSLDCPNKEFLATIDQEAFIKIVSNLLSNAMKYSGGQIYIYCLPNIRENYFEVRVSDNGIGISNEEKVNIFEPFYQIADNNNQGTGIGLSLVKNLVEMHQGYVYVDDVYPSGVIFTIKIPLNLKETQIEKSNKTDILKVEKEKEKPKCDIEIIHSDNLKLLIVEDSIEMSDFISDCFNMSYEVIVAKDGVEGVEMLKFNDVDLIISDLMMPNMNGVEFCKIVKSNILWSHIPVILLTAKTDLDSKIEGMNVGADFYVEKPFSVSYLKAIVNNLLESRKALRKKYSEMPLEPINSIASNQADEDFLTKVNEIFEKNISNENFNMDQLATELCISRSGLFAKIKNLSGLTPNDFLQLIRLKKAAEYLLKNEYRINEVAFMVGFSNPSYFTKCFHKQFGVRPNDFIKKNSE